MRNSCVQPLVKGNSLVIWSLTKPRQRSKIISCVKIGASLSSCRDDDMISYASMMSLVETDRFDDFDDEFEDDNMAKRRNESSFGSFRSSMGKYGA